jgi:hypothetical protein
LRGEVEQYIDNNLRLRYSDVTIEVWGHKRLADEVSKFDIRKIEKILDVSLGTATRGTMAMQLQRRPAMPRVPWKPPLPPWKPA